MTFATPTHRIQQIFVAIVMTLAVAVLADASILMPAVPAFSLPGDDASDAVMTSACDDKSTNDPIDSQVPANLRNSLNPSPVSAPTPTSSSSGGSGGTSPTFYVCLHTEFDADPELIIWVSSGGRLVLPTPVGNELLRPPRA